MKKFNEYNLPISLLNSLEYMKFESPTPIQEQSIPYALEGKDILATAQTGTGKTGAFSIPMLAKLMANPKGCALVLAPTRELAEQVIQTIHKLLGRKSDIKTALLIGGESINKQFFQLNKNPRVLVGTPGRIKDHIDRKTLSLENVDFLVIDEVDRMLDMGFSIQLNQIIKRIPRHPQTLMFSATLPNEILSMSEKYLENPIRITVGSTTTPIDSIKQESIRVSSEKDKYEHLLKELDVRDGSIIIFVKTRRGADQLASKLNDMHHSSNSYHSDLRQNKRSSITNAFRKQKFKILVATDIASRGLDIPHIEHVINYDLPQCPEDYIHRLGRTARAGKEGSALCFINNQDASKWDAIQRLIDPNYKSDMKYAPANFKRNRSRSGSNSNSSSGSKKFGFKSKKRFGFNPKRNGGRHKDGASATR